VQDDASLERFEDVVLVPGFGISQDVGHESLRIPRACEPPSTTMTVLMLLSLLGGRPGQLNDLRHFKAHFIFDDLEEGDVGGAEISDLGNQRPAQASRPGVKLADTAGNQVDQNVGIANLLQCFFRKFSVQGFYR
jgi:hypothetical protein